MSNLLSKSISAIVLLLVVSQLVAPFVQNIPDIARRNAAVCLAVDNADGCQSAAPDAADDLQKDAASGNYNPVALRYGLMDGKWDEESRQAFARTLDHSVHMIATAFELWDFGVWRPVLESTVYTALFAVGRAVLEGTFHKMPPREQRKKHKKETT